jgi:hypothetical protein
MYINLMEWAGPLDIVNVIVNAMNLYKYLF